MRRTAVRPAARILAALLCIVGLAEPGPAVAQGPTRRPAAPVGRAEPGQPPHAWLFGTWTGGLFPAPEGISAEACLSQPVVIFTRDVVLRATLTDQLYTQRLIETALTTTGGTTFRFTAGAPASASLLAGDTPERVGFGCTDPDTLAVERKSENQITFPGCVDFPNPLVRCPSR